MLKNGQEVPIKSVGHALNILNCFRHADALGISEIAARLGRSKSTIHGMVNTLTQWGYLEQNRENRKYRLGLTLLELGHLVRERIDIRSEARPWCQQLTDKYSTTVHLAAVSDGEIVYIDKVDMGSSIVTYSRVGKRAPMYCTGIGKAILAYLPPEYLEKHIFSKPMERFTPNTIVERSLLIEELKKVREQGYAIDNGEIEVGVQCLAAPVFDRDGFPAYAISMSFLQARLEDISLPQISDNIKKYAAAISARIGYSQPCAR